MPTPSELVIALLTAISLFIGFNIFFNELGEDFGVTTNISELNRSEQLIADFPNLSDIIDNKITGLPVLDVPFLAVGGVIQFIKAIGMTAINGWTDFTGAIARLLNIDARIIDILSAIIAIAIFAAIVTPINKYPV